MRFIRRSAYVVAMLVAASCVAREGQDEVEEKLEDLVDDITSWSVWRGPCDAPSWRDFKLLLGTEKSYRELRRLFDELYAVGKDSPEEVLRRLCIDPGGIELTYAAQWFISCDPRRYAPVVARMIARPEDYVAQSDFDSDFSVSHGLKTPAEALRGFLIYMLHGSPGVLKFGDELPGALRAFDHRIEYWPTVLAECDSVAAIDVLVDRTKEASVAAPKALQYATFGFHLEEWEGKEWREWWVGASRLSFDQVFQQNLAAFFHSGCRIAPLMHL